MSLVNLAHVCSHLQNAQKARLGLTSIPLSNLHLSLAHELHKAGFISSVTIGGKTTPPQPDPLLQSQPTSSSSSDESIVTNANRASRRLWLGLKYYNNAPVISSMSLVSKPTRRFWLSAKELREVVVGKRAGYVKGMRGVGECMFVSTDKGVMEARECVERRIGGQVLVRVV